MKTAALEETNSQLVEMDKIKTEFVANVSHELRTPLTAISSFTEILIDELGDLSAQESLKYLGIIEKPSVMYIAILGIKKLHATDMAK